MKSAASGRTADLSRRHKVRRRRLRGHLDHRRQAHDLPGDGRRHDRRGGRGPARRPPRAARRSRTARLRLRGADGYEAVRAGADDATTHLADRYGGEARALLAMVERDPALGEPVVEGLPYLKVEVVWAARHEMARTVDDVLSRRTRARLLARDASDAAADEVGRLLAAELGLSDDEVAAQVADYRAQLAHERAANATATDAVVASEPVPVHR